STLTTAQSTGDMSGNDATAPQTGGLSSMAASVIASPPGSSPTAFSKNVDPSSTTAANEVVVQARSLTTWLSSPRVLAGRTATPVSTLSSPSTATSGVVTSSALLSMPMAAPVAPVTASASPSSPVSSVVLNLVNDLLNPLAGNGPAAPADSPAGWILTP